MIYFEKELKKAGDLFDYFEEKIGEDEAFKLLNKLGFNNPGILISRSLDDCKRIGDKFLKIREVIEE